jgi:thiamine biosynthesis lipoprotein
VPEGVVVDLGATGKAYLADVAARRAAAITGAGVLVSLGGDVSVAGEAPTGGWSIRVAEDPDDLAGRGPGQTVGISTGGLATSSTLLRTWRRGARTMHHILDPLTGLPAPVVWRTVTAAAATCVDANTATTAAVVLGVRAVEWLADVGVPARLVHADGHVVTVGDWPEDRP